MSTLNLECNCRLMAYAKKHTLHTTTWYFLLQNLNPSHTTDKPACNHQIQVALSYLPQIVRDFRNTIYHNYNRLVVGNLKLYNVTITLPT